MPEGKIKFYIETKGFGFIKPDNGDQEIFFHASGVTTPVKQDQKVQYQIQEGKRGLIAKQVKKTIEKA